MSKRYISKTEISYLININEYSTKKNLNKIRLSLQSKKKIKKFISKNDMAKLNICFDFPNKNKKITKKTELLFLPVISYHDIYEYSSYINNTMKVNFI